jgi:hypothetical protein
MTITTCSTCPSPAQAIVQHIRMAMLQQVIIPTPDILAMAFVGQHLERLPPAAPASSSLETTSGNHGGRSSALLVGGVTVIVVCLGIGMVLLLQLIKCRKFQSRIRRKRFDENASVMIRCVPSKTLVTPPLMTTAAVVVIIADFAFWKLLGRNSPRPQQRQRQIVILAAVIGTN